jgi:type II secretory pathway component GspD/PulD (secretin)
VQLLAQEGYLTIRASPRVMARDGERAEISIARQTFFSVQPTDTDVFFRQDIREVEAGINMIITPVVRGDNVQVNIEKAEVSEDIRNQVNDPQLVNNPFPLINRRRVTTNVTVKDGQTIVIGGLVSKQSVDRVSEIPGFGRIPKFGNIFRKIERLEQEAEVVIFISPKIISSNTPVVVTPGT